MENKEKALNKQMKLKINLKRITTPDENIYEVVQCNET